MHLVFATSIVPDGTPTTGYEIANQAIIDGLRRVGARVTVLGFTWPGSAPSDPENTVVLGSVDVRTDNASAVRKADWLMSAIRSGQTFASVKLLGAAGPAELSRALDRIDPWDAVVVNATQMGGAYEAVLTARPFLYVAHNVEHVSALENATAARSLARRMLFQREARLLKSLEDRLCRKAGFVWTLAEDDRAALGVDEDDRSAALALSTPAASAGPPADSDILCEAALIGTWTWAPNRIGLDWFLEKVVPHLPGDFRVRIAGAMPSDLSAPAPNVEFVGRVPDATAFVRQAAVIPLISRAGTGVQLKTIETFELGLPSVATTHALRGVAHRPSNCVVADDPQAFAAALVAAAKHRSAPLDGSDFVRAQREALDAGLLRGLESLDRKARLAA
ncbi:MAG: glycosyltransferase family 4 protein [Rhizobiaceae bacterium]|nr:glycosyltransferase family 4 protein [Rhizobiaceae bacterium]MCV0406072.1 glycosyltransferase family 4 protein [Rhizobiaceae bacterium]